MPFDANERATEKMVHCQHRKSICAPCAIILAQNSYDEGREDQRRHVRELVALHRRDWPSIEARDTLDALLRDLA